MKNIYVVHCAWCDEIIEKEDTDYTIENFFIYHNECYEEMKHERRFEQHLKHAPDNME